MTNINVEPQNFVVDRSFFHKQVAKLHPPVEEQFEFIVRSYVLFHSIFALLLILEVTTLLTLFPAYTHSSVFSITLSLFFLTVFSYLILRLFFSSRKTEQSVSPSSEACMKSHPREERNLLLFNCVACSWQKKSFPCRQARFGHGCKVSTPTLQTLWIRKRKKMI